MNSKSSKNRHDPVCGMQVNEVSEHHHVYESYHYYFCSQYCLDKFQDDPESYINNKTILDTNNHDHQPVLSGNIDSIKYTCPMHPEIIQNRSGSCPKCGMALEPMTATLDNNDEKNGELIGMSRRFWISLPFAVLVFIIAMTVDLFPNLLPQSLSMRTVQWLEFLLATPVVLWGGWPFFVRAWQSLKTWNLNMFTLIGLGVSVAWTYSVIALLFPQMFPPSMQHQSGTVAVYFEASAIITVLVLLGQVLELRARSSTNSAIQALLELAPNTARRILESGDEQDIPLHDVQAGFILRIRPGEKILLMELLLKAKAMSMNP